MSRDSDTDDIARMLHAALAGMATACPRASQDDILNASLTLTLRAIGESLKDPNVSPAKIRQSLELLLLMTVGPKETVQ